MLRVDGVTPEVANLYGLHGLRVLGYNCWRGANGEDVAQLQGGWGSSAHRSYGRETLKTMISVPQRAAAYTDAMKDGERAGWGWCSLSGQFDYGVYGGSGLLSYRI